MPVEQEHEHKWRYDSKRQQYMCYGCCSNVSLIAVKNTYNLTIFNPHKVADKYITAIVERPDNG